MNAIDVKFQDGPEQSAQEQISVATDTEGKPFTDPVCGMKVRANPEKTLAYAGADYHFCSAGCVTRFSADPK